MGTTVLALVAVLAFAFLPDAHGGEPSKPDSIPLGDYTYTREYLSWFIEDALREEDVPGLSIALVDDQRIVWAEGFGVADKAGKRPATKSTVYRAGGLSAPLTATAVMQLVERGDIDLDQPIRRYIPRFDINSRFGGQEHITPRNLLTHHAGLPISIFKGMWTPAPVSLREYIGQLKTQYLAQPPQKVYAHSTMGYSVLGRMIERASDEDFEAYMQQAVLAPVGMKQSSFVLRQDLLAALATGYRHNEEKAQLAVRDTPALGLYTTVGDLGRFVQMLFNEGKSGDTRILEPASVTEMLRVQNAGVALDFDLKVGLGWTISEALFPEAGPVIWQQGATLLFRSRLLVSPRHKLGVVVMANSANAYHTLEQVAEKALALMLETKTGVRVGEPGNEDGHDRIDASRDRLRQWPGDYATILGLFPVWVVDNHLAAELLGWRFQLLPAEGGWMRPRYKLFGVIPIPIEVLKKLYLKRYQVQQKEILVVEYQGERYLFGKRIEPVPVPASWLERLGRYEVAERDALTDLMDIHDGQLEYDGKRLYFSYRLPKWFPFTLNVPLQPLDDTTAVISGLGTGLGETVKVQVIDEKAYLVYSGYALEKVAE